MPRRPKGSGRDPASKSTFNPSDATDNRRQRTQTEGPRERDPKQRTGQFSGAGEAPLMKK
jgi:hypothetical protein